MQRKKIVSILFIFLLLLIFPFNGQSSNFELPSVEASPSPDPSLVASISPPSPVLVVLYKNGSYYENVSWKNIVWGQVDEIGISRTDLGKVGFESNYGSVLWYPLEFNKPLMFIAQRLWGRVGTTWHRFYIQTTGSKTPWFRQESDGWLIGWTGTITYLSYNFPVSIAVKMNFDGEQMYYKTNVTTPINLAEVGIEYRLYANPEWKDYIENHANFIRLYYLNGSTEDYQISGRNLDLTYKIPSLVINIGILTNRSGELWGVNKFNFTDVFESSTNKLLRIERTTLPDGSSTYVVEIGCTFGALAAGKTLEIDPSTLSTSTTNIAVGYPIQRKGFFSDTLHWAFYSDGTYLQFKASPNGISWSSATSCGLCILGSYFSVWFDGTYIHYARYYNYDLFYRRGNPESSYTITWSADEQLVFDGSSSLYHTIPVITVDTNGYAWIGTRHRDSSVSTNPRPYIIKNANNDGTWATASGFPHQLSATFDTGWVVIPVPLTTAKMYVIYGGTVSSPSAYGILYDGGWGSEESDLIDYSTQNSYSFSAVAEGDNVHLVYLRYSTIMSYQIRYNKRTYGVGWGTNDVLVQIHPTSAFNTYAYPTLSLDTTNSRLFCFWATPSTDHVYYKKCTSGTWDINPTDWIDESADGITETGSLSSWYQDYGQKLGLLYMTRTSSPYLVRYAFLSTPIVYYTIIFYFNFGGMFYVDDVPVVNGSSQVYKGDTYIELSATAWYGYSFSNFSWDSSHTHSNPYNYKVTANMTIWCYFETLAVVTFYYNNGGELWVDRITTSNGTVNTYSVNTVIELAAIPQNSNYIFSSFNWTGGSSTSNPYDYATTGNMTIWLYFGSAGVPTPYIFARFDFNVSNPEPTEIILFNGSYSVSSSTITSYNWTFGDGNSGYGATIIHDYSFEGTFTITLMITSSAGSDSFSLNLTVAIAATGTTYVFASFSWTPENPQPNYSAFLNASASNSSSPITNYYWNFGDGNVTEGNYETIYHSWVTLGIYNVSLTVSSAVGNSTFSVPVVVGDVGWITKFQLYPLNDLIIMFIVGLFFSICFFSTKIVGWGIISFVAWLCMSLIWFLIDPVSYSVSLLFMGIAIIILTFTFIAQLESIKQKKRGESFV